MTTEPTIERVAEISGEVGVDLGLIAVRARYHVTEGKCQVQISYWLKLDIGFQTITIRHSMDWVGCEEGLATALALADRLGLDLIELDDPENAVPESLVSSSLKAFRERKTI